MPFLLSCVHKKMSNFLLYLSLFLVDFNVVYTCHAHYNVLFCIICQKVVVLNFV